MNQKIAVIGSGAREHALCWKLNLSSRVSRIYAIPGNSGTELCEKVTNVEINLNDFETIVDWCTQYQIDFVIVGPEVPLAKGISNTFSKNGILCFGPSSEASRIEADKQWSKRLMDKYNISTAQWKSFTNPRDAKKFIESTTYQTIVVKASGLAAGKGVIIASNKEEACDAVDDIMTNDKFGEAGSTVIVEEYLEGDEVSMLAFTDGKTVKCMLPVRDHKRLLNDDEGPNTGGMGTFCPYVLSDDDLIFIRENILQKTVDGLSRENATFVGVLYAGLMLTANGIKVLEFNCRFGDPEAQVLMPLLQTDLSEIVQACCNGTLDQCDILWKRDKCSVCVVMTSEGYPFAVKTGNIISGLSETFPDVHIFRAATALTENNDVVTAGGRVLSVVAVDEIPQKASANAISACSKIKFSGCHYRTDIAYKGIARYILKTGTTTYSSAGVNINSGNELIKNIKELLESTFNEKVLTPIGSFAAVVDAKLKEYSHPLIVSGCDGIGTKLKIAQQCNNHVSIGQDLVAMCVNDVLAHGAKPLFFLDYFACGKLNLEIVKNVISGIVDGCKKAECALVGGETAEMPGFYGTDEYDLAGFAVGIVEKHEMLPKNSIKQGDKIVYLPSNGMHSNGFSLVRKIMNTSSLQYQNKAAFSKNNKTYEEELLQPTTIYVNEILPLVEQRKIKAFAHITGGGLLENIVRVLPANLKANLDAKQWEILPIFAWIAAEGNVNEREMLRTFNCGVGGIVVVDAEFVEDVTKSLKSNVIGEIESRIDDEPQVNVANFTLELGKLMTKFMPSVIKPHYKVCKRVAVLISGVGTNLKTLIKTTSGVTSEARIVLVISSKETAHGLKITEQHDIPSAVIKRDKNVPGETNDRFIHSLLTDYEVDIVCLAGYMHILSEWFVLQWRGKILNIHPSLLPSFKGMHAQKQALEAGVKVTGCTVHFVEVEIDSGAIIEQDVVRVCSDDTVGTLTERIKEREHVIYSKALQMVASGKVSLDLQRCKIVYK